MVLSVHPDLSLVMPCYNEEAIVDYTIRRLLQAFDRAGYRLEIVAVDNGSHDRTGAILKELAAQRADVTTFRVEQNEGYGNGILRGLPVASAPLVGIIPADGQVDAEDVVHLYEAAVAANGNVLAKVRRRFRMDGLLRKIVSGAYNLFVRVLWPRLGSIDINGSPKILPRALVPLLQLQSKGWLLDPELMLKAHYLGLRVLEFNVFARMRGNGLSHVRPRACWDFFKHLLHYRFSWELHRWRRGLPEQLPTIEVRPQSLTDQRPATDRLPAAR
jgi:glycosyltransferase involved in cell wall biosynthesis